MASCAGAGSGAGALRGSQTPTATQLQNPSPGPSPGKNTTTNSSSTLKLYRNTSCGVKRKGPQLFKTTIKKHGFHQQHPASQKRGNSSSQPQPQPQQQQPAAQQNAKLSPLQEQLRDHLQRQQSQQLLRERLLQALGGSSTPDQQAGCSDDTACSSSVARSASLHSATCSPSAAQPLQPQSAMAQKLQQALLTRVLQQGQHLGQQQQQIRARPAAAVKQPQQQQEQRQQEEHQQQRQLLMQLILQAADEPTAQPGEQQQQQQQGPAASRMPPEALIAKRLIEQAAIQVSPALGEQLHQQVKSKVEAAALVAAAAGYEFDLAVQLQQLLPDLAQQVQQSCSEAVARNAVAATASSTLQQSSGMPSAAAIAEVVARTTACAEHTVKCVTSLIMQGYQPAAAAAATFNASNAAAPAPSSDVQSSNANGGGSSSAVATQGPTAVTATVQALLQALQQLPAPS